MIRLGSKVVCVIALLAWLASSPAAAAPQINNISLRGLTIGQPTTIVIDGADLLPDPHLVVPLKLAGQKVKPGATSARVEIEVTLDASATPGIYWLRIGSGKGISNPVAMGVDSLSQTEFVPQLNSLPIALHGNVGAVKVLTTKFTGVKGMPIVIDCEAQRIGSMLKPIVRLYDSRGKQLVWSPPLRNLGGDARCEVVLPANGEYTIELHEQLYRNVTPSFFRLKIGALKFADLTLPLAVSAGSKASLTLVGGNLPGTIDFDASGVSIPGERPITLPASAGITGAAPGITVSEFPELLEAPATAGQLQSLPQAPVGISGVLNEKGEEDKFLLTVTPGQKLRFDTFAQRVGSPLDGVLSIRGAGGNQLAASDDRPGTSDPGLDFTVPANVSQLQIALKDLESRGGANFVYRIEARDLSRPDFTLSLPADRINIPAGGTQVLPVTAVRMGYDGPIELQFEGLPSEITVEGNVVPPGASIALVTLTATGTAPLAGVTTLVGRIADSQPPVARAARFDDQAGSRYQPFLREQFGYAIAETSPIKLVWTASEGERLLLGGKTPAKLQLTRAANVPGNVRVRLVTTQPTPQKTIKVNNQDKVVDDVDRTLRLDGAPSFNPQQTELDINFLVPSDLPRQPWDLVLVADLLGTDNKTVVTSVATPVRKIEPIAPFALELAGQATAEGKAGAGETGKFTGKVVRAAGYTQGIVVTLEGLPNGYSAPTVLVPADESEFTLPLTFPFGAKPGELKNVKLVALAAPASATSVRSNSVAVTVNVTPGEKPDAEPPKEIFEDDEAFAALLTEGGGRAIPEQRDKYAGQISLRVTPDQKLSPMLPSLGVKIRENPGPGEYRYLRFAWKKTGGNSICLQLNHDGMFGPGGSGREGASFRYHAGPGGQCYGASLVIDAALPAKFEVVTRDLFADFGEFTLNGLAFSPVDGQAALFDHLYLGRGPADFDLIGVEKAKAKGKKRR